MLAPAGNPVIFGFAKKARPAFDGYTPVWLNSGTAALALAIELAKQKKRVEKPEIIIPAYACPDLVSACEYAGVRCRLCDLDQNNTAYSLQFLRSIINENTIGIIAINFLGIEERLVELSKLANENQITFIEDNAQWFPELNHQKSLTGDIVCLSFGRGKPVSLLGGGAAIVNDELLQNPKIKSIIAQHESNGTGNNSLTYILKCLAYNAIINPALYSLINYVPGLTIGKTIYKPLESINTLDNLKARFLSLNIDSYIHSEPTAQLYLQTRLDDISDDIINLPTKYLDRTKRLLRYPILTEDRITRDSLLNELTRYGLGATKLYGTILPSIPGTKKHILNQDDFPNATDFADRLITLPVHSHVQRKHLNKIETLIKQY